MPHELTPMHDVLSEVKCWKWTRSWNLRTRNTSRALQFTPGRSCGFAEGDHQCRQSMETFSSDQNRSAEDFQKILVVTNTLFQQVPSPKKSSRVQRHRHGDSSSVRQEEDPASEVCRRAASYESLAPGCATRSHRAPSQTRLASLSARTALNCPPRSVGGERRAPVQCGPAGERGARRECLWSTRMLRAAARAMLAATVVWWCAAGPASWCEQSQILVVVRDTCSRARSTGRLYVKGLMMGFKRGLRNQHEDTVILKVHNVADADSTQFYLGKRVCYIYK